MKKILLLGHSGKMGTALHQVLEQEFMVVGKNSTDFEASDFSQVRGLIREERPWAIVNTVAFLGIDPAEKEAHRAFTLNTLYPKVLAQTARETGSILVHFSTDAVFNDSKGEYYVESDPAAPLNIYGLTKFGGDCQIQSLAEQFYILRLPILFGPTDKQDQFVEKMLQLVKEGHTELKIATDILSSPTYSLDVAKRVKDILQELPPWGLYHVSNAGVASLFDLMQLIVQELGLQVRVSPASYLDFPHVGRKNTCTPLATEKLVPMRPWQEAVQEYCQRIQHDNLVKRSSSGRTRKRTDDGWGGKQLNSFQLAGEGKPSPVEEKAAQRLFPRLSNMDNKLLMEGCKLMWHPDRVAQWLAGERIAPLHIDVGLSKGCNIRCEYCFGVMQNNFYKKGRELFFPREPLLEYLNQAGQAGVRSMAFIGEAEPTLNPHLYEAIVAGKKAGIDISLGTNGILYDTGRQGEEALEHLSWIRFNISAADKKSYARIHGSKDFDQALDKIRFCVNYKQRHSLEVTIGLQMVLTPNNKDQALPLARLGAELGVDYLVIKQCSDARDNTLGIYEHLEEYQNFQEVLKTAEQCTTDSYQVIVKWDMISNQGRRNYDRCLGAPFLLYSSGDGRLYPCGMFFGRYEKEFRLGDLTREGFISILQSKRYQEVMDKVAKLDVHNFCYANCRTHFINDYVWRLKHPPAHVNFV